MNKNIIIFREELLPFSETFILNQVESLSSYTGIYVGFCRTRKKSLVLPKQRTIILGDIVKLSSRRSILLKLTGIASPKLYKYLRKFSPHLIHAHFGIDGVWALPIASQLKVPLIVTFHGHGITVNEQSENLTNIYGPLYKAYFWKRQNLFSKARYCIAISQFIRSQLIAKGCPEHKIKVHYIGIDIDKFTPKNHIVREPIVL
ncbi:MAG: glycosyltransferase, partial [Okeania sp. SIO2D1]|nr:glycosyltransferase [Okeania sp. SIO2D1]